MQEEKRGKAREVTHSAQGVGVGGSRKRFGSRWEQGSIRSLAPGELTLTQVLIREY